MSYTKISRALISVSDKSGLLELANLLHQNNIEIISTGGTAKYLSENNIPITAVSDLTNFPEILDGRVKTLHPSIHAGLLADLSKSAHEEQLKKHGIKKIDLVIVNLYPFEKTIENKSVALDEAIEQIDIGGPAMLRASAKNFKFTTVVCNVNRYEELISELKNNNFSTSYDFRYKLANEVFSHTSNYDLLISNFLQKDKSGLPEVFSISAKKDFSLRYGENPHQQSSFYGELNKYFSHLHGKELSYNNILDINAAQNAVNEFDEPTVVIVKHTNPCGVGSDEKLSEAFKKAFATDKKSPFGGIISVNKKMDLECAKLINEIFVEVVIAPEFSDEALQFLRETKKERRIIQSTKFATQNNFLSFKNIFGGVLVQTPDNKSFNEFKVVTNRKPNEEELLSMHFAWKVAKNVHSNAIVYANKDRTLAIGAGQMSRVDSAKIASWKAQNENLNLNGCAVASDAFFPFSDGLLEVISAGATAVIQPGGSVRDLEVIETANKNNVAMIFTGTRHFKH